MTGQLSLAPELAKLRWRPAVFDGRQYLFADGERTGYFVSTTYPPSGFACTLHLTGADPSGCALSLGFHRTIGEAKRRAEWLRLNRA